MRILRKYNFIKGIVNRNYKLCCNKCKKIFQLNDDIYIDGSQKNYDLCKKCYLEEINE